MSTQHQENNQSNVKKNNTSYTYSNNNNDEESDLTVANDSLVNKATTQVFTVCIYDISTHTVHKLVKPINIKKFPPSKYADNSTYYAIETIADNKKVRTYYPKDAWEKKIESKNLLGLKTKDTLNENDNLFCFYHPFPYLIAPVFFMELILNVNVRPAVILGAFTGSYLRTVAFSVLSYKFVQKIKISNKAKIFINVLIGFMVSYLIDFISIL